MKKLVAVAGITRLRLFIAEKHHFTETLPEIAIERDKTHRLSHSENHYHQKVQPDSSFEPHTTPEEIEHMESAKDISKELLAVIKAKNIQEVIVVAEPRMLGFLRKHLDPSIKKLIIDEIGKDYLQIAEKELVLKIFEKK